MTNDPRKDYRERFSQGDAEQQSAMLASEEQQFEHERVKFVLHRLKLKHHEKDVGRLWKERTGNWEFRFAAVNSIFPTFPFLIGCHRLRGLPVPWGKKVTPANYTVHEDPYSTEPNRYKKFDWVPYVIAYQDFYNSAASDSELRHVALVFPRKGFLHGMVLYNDDTEKYWTHGLAEVYKAKNGRKLYKMPFASLIEAVYDGGHGWRPPSEI